MPNLQKHLIMLSSLLDSFKSTSNNMPISSPNPIKFIEDALFCANPFSLSYSDPDQKWIIREHLISLFQDYPSLKPSTGVFTHNDGTDVRLLNANGQLRVSHHAPPVPLTIWLHEFYPHMAPIVYINSVYPIYENYPFADSSGVTTCSYLENWRFTKSNLSGLARNLIKLFSYNHPFYYSGPSSSLAHPFTLSKMEAMDLLACSIYHDAAATMAKTREEIEDLTSVQFELGKRGEILRIGMSGLEEERSGLKGRIGELCEESDKVLSWLKEYEGNSGLFAIDDVFEASNRESKLKVECCAADLAADDLMDEMDKAVEQGFVSFDVYMKQVRMLAREQFMHRAMGRKIENTLEF